MVRILVVDDDRNTRKLFSEILAAEGYEVLSAANGVEALELMDTEQVHLAVVDVMMPEMDGLEFTKMLRQIGGDLPILMVSAKALSSDIKAGLRAGSDDYMTKPIDPEEMVLRVKALLRRFQISVEQKIRIGDVVLDEQALTVSRGSEVVELPQKEFMLLFKLLSYPNKIYTRRQLMDEIWDMESDSDERTVDVHIGRVREKFRDNTDFEIVTVRGLGYRAIKREDTL